MNTQPIFNNGTSQAIKQYGTAAGISLAAALLLVLSGCLTATEEAVINEALNPDVNAHVEVPFPDVPAGCFNERFTQPAAEVTRKLDILFITDTSASLDEERAGIAQGIDSFIGALPAEADIQVAAMLAHGSHSVHTGKLFQSSQGEPRVLANTGAGALTVAEIRAHLGTKLSHVAGDNASDGGETGMYATTQLLSPSNLSLARSQGFFRDDAALAVVYISDEQDVCYSYPAGVSTVVDPQGLETSSKSEDCAGITPASVVQKLRELQGDRPLLVASVIYTDRETFTRTGENEIGYGWREMAELANGITIDLASPHYEQGLAQIGTMALVKMNLQSEFALTHASPDGASIQVKVDGHPAPFAFVEDTAEVQLSENLGTALSTIDVTYCQKNAHPKISAFCQTSAPFTPKGSVSLGLSVDPAEGTQNTIVNGFNAIGHPATLYSDAEVAAGKPIADGKTVLAISRKVRLTPLSASYIQGVKDFVAAGGSLLTEYDGAALLFDQFSGSDAGLVNAAVAPLALFAGLVRGGGALLPLESSRLYVTDALHPIMEGMPANFLLGVRAAYAVTEYDSEWLHPSANFISTGYENMVPEGTYPAVLSGTCNAGRVAAYTMTDFQIIHQNPASRMVRNTLRWLSGVQ